MEISEPDKPKPKRRGNPKSGLTGSEAMRLWNASRTPEQRDATRQKQSDAVVCNMWKGYGSGNPFGNPKRGRNKVDPNTSVGNTTLAKIEKASVKRILKDLVGTQPELIKDAIIAGLLAPPPRSFPYIALAAAYLDGKPVDAEPPSERLMDLSNLTRDELMQRALGIAQRLKDDADERVALARESAERTARSSGLAVIDAEVIPNKEDK